MKPPLTKGHCPVTRSLSGGHINVVSEPPVMGDTDNQMEQLLEMMRKLSADQASLSARVEALSQQRVEASSARKDGNTSHSRIPGAHQGENSSGKDGRNGAVPRYTKLEFPIYNGKEDPLGWLTRCEQFFVHQNNPREEWIGLASFHMTGTAQLWFLQLEKANPHLTWEEFKKFCNMRFGPPVRSNPVGELISLKQTSTVEEYLEKFQGLLARTDSIICEHQVAIMTAGLSERLRIDVELAKPENLEEAMGLARAFERRLQLEKIPENRKSWTPEKTPTPTRPTAIGAGPTLPPFIKRLSRAEMAERRAKGLCYNCDELFTPGHQCKRLFWLEVATSEEEEHVSTEDNLGKDLEISVHALTGIQNTQTMQLGKT